MASDCAGHDTIPIKNRLLSVVESVYLDIFILHIERSEELPIGVAFAAEPTCVQLETEGAFRDTAW